MPHVAFSLPDSDGRNILVEVDTPKAPVGLQQAGRPAAPDERGTKAMDEALATLAPLARCIRGALDGLDTERIAVEFGCNLTADGQLVVFRGGATANFKVNLSWKTEKPSKPAVKNG